MANDLDHFWRATIAAALLRQGRWLAGLSAGLILIALAGLTLALAVGRPAWALPNILSLVAGLAALWLSLRVSFDAELFAVLAGNDDLAGFDHAMTGLGLMPVDRAGRELDQRISGAIRLLKGQAIAVAVQAAVLVVGVLLVSRLTAP